VDLLSEPRLSSFGRPGEDGPLHRGGGSCRSQREALLRNVRGLQVRLVRAQEGRPSHRELSDRELTEKIAAVRTESKARGPMARPGSTTSSDTRASAAGGAGSTASCAKPASRVAARSAGARQGARPRPRRRGGQGPYPAALRALHRARPTLRRRHDLGGLGISGHGHRPGQPQGGWQGTGRPHMRTELVEEALEMAFVARRTPPGAIFHSDRGCQYTRTDYAGLARECKVVLSVGMAGECWDKAVADRSSPPSSASSSRPELGPTRAGPRRGAFDYIEGWYNTRQLHSSLGHLSPAGYEARISDSVGRQAARSNATNLSVEPIQAQTRTTGGSVHGDPVTPSIRSKAATIRLPLSTTHREFS